MKFLRSERIEAWIAIRVKLRASLCDIVRTFLVHSVLEVQLFLEIRCRFLIWLRRDRDRECTTGYRLSPTEFQKVRIVRIR